jgi:hypothetical protein
MKKTFKSLMIAALGFCALASAQMPTSMLFQGMLTKSGSPVSSNNESLILKVCTAKTGDNCTTVFDGSVVVLNGYYSALMTGLPPMDKPYWIEVVANNTIASARIPLTASPYALRANVADSVAAGAAVRSLNGLGDNVNIISTNDLVSVSASGSTVSVTAKSAQDQLLVANATCADWNALTTTGLYHTWEKSNCVETNAPTGAWRYGQLEVTNSGMILQRYYPNLKQASNYYIRSYYDGSGWSDWKTVSY